MIMIMYYLPLRREQPLESPILHSNSNSAFVRITGKGPIPICPLQKLLSLLIHSWIEKPLSIFYIVDDQDFALDNTFGGIIVFPESDADIDAALRRSCFNVFITDDSISENVESFSLLLELDTFVEQSGIRVDPNATVISIIDADGVFLGT